MTDKHDKEVTRLTTILLRALPNWDRETLSRHSGVYPSQLSSYENGKVTPRPKNLGRIAAAVQVEPPLLAHIQSYLGELVTAWKNGSDAPAPSPFREESHSGAEVLGQEAARARAELALLVNRRRGREGS